MYLHCCLLVVVAAAVVHAASLDKRSDCICQSIESPVCGKDGRDYASRCNALCAGTDEAAPGNCLRIEHPIHIPTLRRLSRTSPIWCNCRATAPVCSTKGNTYGNSGCAECFGEEVAHTGECPKKENGVQLPENVPEQLPADIFRRELEAILHADRQAPCVCVMSYDPVCGSDGQTYDNADCARSCGGVEVAHKGECRRKEDGVQLPELSPEQLPAGIERRNSHADRQAPCACVMSYDPVCGSDGQTYDNADCARSCGGVEVAHKGECRKKEDGVQLPELSPEQLPAGIERRNSHADRQAPCACVMSYDPVCGSDGQTYDNADCARSCGGVEVAHKGECRKKEDGVQLPELSPEQLPAGIERRNSHADRQAPCACVRSYLPVCGSDGRSYDNPDCARRCGGVEVAYTGKCRKNEDGVQLPEYVPEQLPADIFRRELEAVLLPELSPELYDNDKTAGQLPAGIERRNSHADRQAPCACVRSHIPVCGNDGRTHDNPDCARNCGTNVFVWRLGTCEDTCSLLACSKDNKEICRGGVRYANKCYWNCLNVPESTRIEVPSDKRC